jgi:hypothetical protein
MWRDRVFAVADRYQWRYEQMGHEYVWRWFKGKELEFRTGKSIAIDNCLRFGKWK